MGADCEKYYLFFPVCFFCFIHLTDTKFSVSLPNVFSENGLSYNRAKRKVKKKMQKTEKSFPSIRIPCNVKQKIRIFRAYYYLDEFCFFCLTLRYTVQKWYRRGLTEKNCVEKDFFEKTVCFERG